MICIAIGMCREICNGDSWISDVDDMYSKIMTFMLEENKQAKKKIFENIKSMTEEEAIRSVGKFLMQGRT